MTEWFSNLSRPGGDGDVYGLPGNTGVLYKWLRILAGGVSEFSEVKMRGPIYDKNGVEILGGASSGAQPPPHVTFLPPTPADDSSLGYIVGSTWLATSSGQYWKAVSVALGAAVWVRDSLLYYNNNLFQVNAPTATLQPTTTNTVALGTFNPLVNLDNHVAIGNNSTIQANSSDSIVLGYSGTAAGSDAVVIGSLGFAESNCVTIGTGQSNNVDCVNIGGSASGLGQRTIVIGDGINSNDNDNVLIGKTINSNQENQIIIGNLSTGVMRDTIQIGHNIQIAGLAGTDSIGIGVDIQLDENDSIGIGYQIQVVGNDSVLIGSGNSAGNFCVGLGDDTDALLNNSLCIGANADSIPGGPLLNLAFGGINPVTTTAQFARLPTRVAATNRNILMRDTDLAIDDLSDVAITSAANTNYLQYNSTNWANSSLSTGWQMNRVWYMPQQAFQFITLATNNTDFTLYVNPGPTFTCRRINVFSARAGPINVAIYDYDAPAALLAQATAAASPGVDVFYTFTLGATVTMTKNKRFRIALSSSTTGSFWEGPAGFGNTSYDGFVASYYTTGAFPANVPGLGAGTRRHYFQLLP